MEPPVRGRGARERLHLFSGSSALAGPSCTPPPRPRPWQPHSTPRRHLRRTRPTSDICLGTGLARGRVVRCPRQRIPPALFAGTQPAGIPEDAPLGLRTTGRRTSWPDLPAVVAPAQLRPSPSAELHILEPVPRRIRPARRQRGHVLALDARCGCIPPSAESSSAPG